MSYCLNPKCPDPSNQPNPKERTCSHCGSDLLLNGQYRAVKMLGSGGFGKTFEIEDNGALKVLKVLYKNHPKAVSLFKQEAKVLCRLNHPGIPKVRENGYFVFWPKDSKEPVHCLVMEKIDGLNLMEWLRMRRNEPIDRAQAVEWLKQLVEILEQVHQQHYFHRDIKPHNIMRRPQGQLALIDFGTAREVTGTYLNKVGGGQNVTEIISAGYTPPEQINGKAVPQSDFYALGRTFVYLLTGKRPTEFPEHPRTGKLIWRDSAPQIPDGFADVIDYMMAPFPGNRPQHAQMILKSLAEVEPTLENSSRTKGTSARYTSGTGSVATGSRRTDISGFPGAHSGLGTGASGLRSGASGMRSQSWIEQWQDRARAQFRHSSIESLKPLAIGSLLVGLVATQAYGYWRYRSFPMNPIRVVANLPSSWFLRKTLKQEGEVKSVAVSPNGNTLASGSYGSIRLWNSDSGDDPKILAAHNNWIGALAIDPDSQILASGSTDRSIRLWNLDSGVRRLTLAGHNAAVNDLAFSRDGKMLASGSEDKTIRLWNVASGVRLLTLSGHTEAVNAVEIAPDRRVLVSASSDRTIKVWDLDRGILIRTLTGHVGAVRDIAISPDGKLLASASSDNTSIVWNLETGKRLHSFNGHRSWVRAVVFSPDGRSVVSAGDTIEIWRADTGEHQRTLRGGDSWVEDLAVRSDGTIVSGSHDRTIKIWRLPD
ncbi:serine/threonine protein kinase [Oscillatoriales cyanobacterium LEGE 11467]|uniref:Serine/threonine protein kinase n=1 Tax=Zarconia navalis LEGE 11467 TaxID=1828826 RepID=A0A928Z7F8_9CYAN|nr:serine/threonine-protein kinase [Zarconia navalis]MBE9040495.1 serine/threonine protein kinase [Zarconia navalis LEGE 11467]